MRTKTLQRVCLLLCGVVVLLPVSCDDNPVGPRPGAKNYYFYSNDMSGPILLRFAPATGVLDTVNDTLHVGIQNVSADGRYLYVTSGGYMSVYKIETDEYIRTLPYPTWTTAVSPDGKYVALFGEQRLGVRLYQIPEYSQIYSDDSAYAVNGVFSRNSQTLYYIDGSTPEREVAKLDLCGGFRLSRKSVQVMPGGIIQAVPSIDEKLWFLYSRWDAFGCSFGVYDVAGDSLIYRTDFSPGGGWIVVSPDGSNVFFTNPGTMLIGPPAPSAFYVYDIPTNTVKEVSTRGLADDSVLGDYLPVGPIAISPDGKSLVGARAVNGMDVVVFDVPGQTITNYYYFDQKAWFGNIKCQTGR
ncbi:MAG: hypothetical protein AB1644_05015 [Candidatus Zixiibacteriota bacterium]